MMELHLFSTSGEHDIEFILEACSSILEGLPGPVVAYLPAASVHRRWVRETRAAFRGLAQIVAINPETHPPERIRAILDQASMLYIPGGNTYLLSQRLHACLLPERGGSGGLGSVTLLAEIRARLRASLPLVAFSAGAVLCGVDILTTNDINCCGCTQFDGLGLLPFNLNVHYPGDDATRQARDERLQEYLAFHPGIVVALEDGAYLRVLGEEISLIRGTAWRLERGAHKSSVMREK